MLFPEIATEWHPTKNADLKPENVTSGSDIKVWWKCPIGDDHEWETNIYNRSKGSGCPFCAGQMASKSNNFLVLFPEITTEWHPTKNAGLKPENFTSGSNRKVWWKCLKGDDHEWEATTHTRSKGSGCPFCSGHKASKSNNFLVLFPKILTEWHPTKNADLKPENFTSGSGENVWWKCSKSDDHEWEAAINKRSSGSGCPFCSGQTSVPEIRILCEIMYLFGPEKVKWREKIDGVEVDIYIPAIKTAVEYDGSYWHRNKESSDLTKNKFLEKKGIKLFRVREFPLEAISGNDLIIKNSILKNDLNTIILKLNNMENTLNVDSNSYIKNKYFLNDKEFNRFISFLPAPPPEYSITQTHPDMVKQWHPTKNGYLKPENFTSGSNKKVWWKCPKGDDHEWEAALNTRRRGSGCPFCSGRKATKLNNFLVLFPEIATEWHPTKNADLKPENFKSGSNEKVWWLCDVGHVWEAIIVSRTNLKRGCPKCARLARRKTNPAS